MKKALIYIPVIVLFVAFSMNLNAQDETVSSTFKGTLFMVDGTTIEGEFIGGFREGYVPEAPEFANVADLDAGKESKQIIYRYPFKKRFKYKKIKAKDVTKLVIDENEIYDVINYKPGAIAGSLDVNKMVASANEKFVKRLYRSEYIGVYKSAEEYIFYKEGEKSGLASSTLGFKKKLAKLTGDCPELSEKMLNDEYQGIDQYIEFAREYTECKK